MLPLKNSLNSMNSIVMQWIVKSIAKFSSRIEQLNEFHGKVVEFYIDQTKLNMLK